MKGFRKCINMSQNQHASENEMGVLLQHLWPFTCHYTFAFTGKLLVLENIKGQNYIHPSFSHVSQSGDGGWGGGAERQTTSLQVCACITQTHRVHRHGHPPQVGAPRQGRGAMGTGRPPWRVAAFLRQRLAEQAPSRSALACLTDSGSYHK